MGGLHRASFRAMGTTVTLALDPRPPHRGRARALLEEGARLFSAYEARFSRFRADSELSALNGCAGQTVVVSPALFDVLERAARHTAATGGLFDPGILPFLEAAGYDRDFAALRHPGGAGAGTARTAGPPPQPPAAAAGPRTGARRYGGAFQLDRRSGTVHLAPGARLDLGGIVKGWAADRVAEFLMDAGDALVDAGGDIRAAGSRAWPVGVLLPGPGGSPGRVGGRIEGRVEPLVLRNGAVATSSVLGRQWPGPDGPCHHLIDPRSGRPAASDIVQATVVAPSAEVAEVWAKVLVVAGSRAARRLPAHYPELAALWVLRDGRVRRAGAWPSPARGAAEEGRARAGCA